MKEIEKIAAQSANAEQTKIDFPAEIIEKYTGNGQQNGVGGFPTDEQPIHDKCGKDFARAWANTALAHFFQGNTFIPVQNRDRMLDLRRYINGTQTPDRYYKMLFGSKVVADPSQLEKRLGAYRSNFKIESVAPNIMESILARIDENDFYAEVSSINPHVAQEKEMKKWKMMMRGKIFKQVGPTMQAAGVDIPAETMVDSFDELNLLESVGGLKNAEELNLESIANHTKNISDIEHQKPLWIRDATAFSKIVGKVEFDRYDGRVYIRYVDPVNFVALASNHYSSNKFIFAGEVRLESIKKIRLEAKATGKMVSESELLNCAKNFMSYYGNSTFSGNMNAREFQEVQNTGLAYDNFKVPVFEGYYLSVDQHDRALVYSNGQWEYKYKDQKNADSPEFQFNTTKELCERYYKVKMVVGTDIIYDWGPQRNVIRDTPNTAMCPYIVAVRPFLSITERIESILDDIAIDAIKFQNDKSRAWPNMIAISKQAIAQNNREGKVDEMEVLEAAMLGGKLVYNEFVNVGLSMMQQGVPIKEIAGGMGTVLAEYRDKYTLSLMKLNEILQYKSADAKPRVAVDALEMSETNATRGIHSVLSMWKQFNRSALLTSFNLVKQAIKYNKDVYNNYYPIVGRTALETMKITADITSMDMAVNLVMRPTATEIQMDLQALVEQAKSRGAASASGYYGTVYFAIRNALMYGRKNEAHAYMVYADERKKREEETAAQKAQMLQSELATRLEQAKTTNQITLIWEKAKASVWEKTQIHNLDKNLLLLQSAIDKKAQEDQNQALQGQQPQQPQNQLA